MYPRRAPCPSLPQRCHMVSACLTVPNGPWFLLHFSSSSLKKEYMRTPVTSCDKSEMASTCTHVTQVTGMDQTSVTTSSRMLEVDI